MTRNTTMITAMERRMIFNLGFLDMSFRWLIVIWRIRANSAAGHRAHDQERLNATGDLIRQLGLRRLERQVLFAGKEANEGPTLQRAVIANRPTQDGILCFERIQNCANRGWRSDLNLYLAFYAGEVA